MKLAVEVADAAELSAKDGSSSCNAFVEVEFDGQRQRTATRPGDLSPQWNETLVFDVRDPARLSALTVDVSVQHDRSLNDHNALRPHVFLGRVRVSGESVARSPDEAFLQRFPLDKRGLFSRVSGDIALRLYLVPDARDGDRVEQDHAAAAPAMDTGGGQQQNQQQPSQPVAGNLDPERMAPPPGSQYGLTETKPPLPAKMGPRSGTAKIASTYDMVEPMSYLYVTVVKARDLPSMDLTGALDPYVEVKLGNFKGVTRHLEKNQNPEKVAAGRDEPIGRIIIPVASPYVPRNDLAKSIPSKWFNLSRGMTVDEAAAEATTGTKHREHSKTFASKIHLRMSLETAYHVLDESTHYSSDLQPAAKKLRKSAIGVLEVGILSARGLGGNKSPYCVAKYGSKWVRTRTLLGTAAPAWNEQYTWEVFDLSTVITVAVFDNNHLHHSDGKDQRIGKVRVRLATLESDRVYTHYYPLMALTPGGLKKTGELHLAVRFTCTAWANMLAQYGRPLLPKMHYSNPISVLQLDYLRFQAMQMGERAQSLLSWRDPRATAIFITMSLIVAVVLYITPFQVVAVVFGLFMLRHPRFRSKQPSVPFNFYKRLPAKGDMLL
uniref:C2 domain-containing protein n=1 Tax=Aegilops tauschii TaxID=37682 RepID=M8AYS9_AEGTA